MLIRAYGLFWSRDEVDWSAGPGNQGKYMLLGHQGEKRPKLRVADFRMQSGLYILLRRLWSPLRRQGRPSGPPIEATFE